MKKALILTGSLIVILIIAVLHFYSKCKTLQYQNDMVFDNLLNSETEMTLVKNQVQEEKELVKSLMEKNEDLAKEIIRLNKAKQKVKYVTVTEFKTETVVQTLKVLPDSYTFYTDFGMPVCLYNKIEEAYEFKTLPVKYTADIIITEESTLVKVKAFSEHSNKEYKLPVETNTTKIQQKEDKVFNPKLSLGLSIDSSLKPASTLSLSLFQKNKFDFVKADLHISDNVTFGLTPVSYNFSDHIPLFNDISIGLGISTDLNSKFATVTLSTGL